MGLFNLNFNLNLNLKDLIVGKKLDVRVVPNLKYRHILYGEIYNSGSEDLENFNVRVIYSDTKGPQEKKNCFYNKPEDIIIDHPKQRSILMVSQLIIFRPVPTSGACDKYKVIVEGRGIHTGKQMKKQFEFRTIKI